MTQQQDAADSVRSRSLTGYNSTCMSRHISDRVIGDRGGLEAGAIFTRSEVVDFILDLAGYTEDQPLYKKRILEPSFGAGDFLLPIIERLLAAWRVARPNGSALGELADAIRAVELHHETFIAPVQQLSNC